MIPAASIKRCAQDFVLEAVRDKMRTHRTKTLDDRRCVALTAFYRSKRTPQNFKEAMDKWLAPYLPEP